MKIESDAPLPALPGRWSARDCRMRLADLPKGRFEAGDDALDKAQAMLRQGKPAAFVSDYLGMDAGQVAEIRDGISLRAEAQARRPGPAPKRDRSADEHAARRRDAVRGSRALAAAIARLLAKSG